MEEIIMEKENELLLSQIMTMKEKLFISNLALENIEKILLPAITINIKKTQRITSPSIVKSYRENLLVLRDIEREIRDWHEETFLHKRK